MLGDFNGVFAFDMTTDFFSTLFDNKATEATHIHAFAVGKPLLEYEQFKVHASRRDTPGMAEVHTRDTDVVYVLQGSATLITGGTMVGGAATAQDEIRGVSIDGGSTRRLVKGDVVVVPNGVPHWFKQVQGPLLYYVVKVTAPAAGDGGGAR